jgi:predicted DNA-binding transcriptional regulator AlpA
MKPTNPPPAFAPSRADPAGADVPLPPAQLALTVRLVAQLLGMSEKAIYHRAGRGQLPGMFRVGRSLRFRRSDLLRSLSEGRGLSPESSR